MSEHSLVFMPWLTVKEPVTIGGWHLSPLVIDPERESDLDRQARNALEAEGMLALVTEILAAYRVTETYPITCCTIVHRVGSTSLVLKLTDEDLDEIASLGEVITFVTLASREFFTSASGGYCNAQTSRLLTQHFDSTGIPYTVTNAYRRDVGARVFRTYSEFREYPPSNTDVCYRWDFDQALGQACWAARSKSDNLWARLSDAIVYFNAANRDEPTAPRYNDLVQSVSALQWLLDCHSKSEKLARVLPKVLGKNPYGLCRADLNDSRPHPEPERRKGKEAILGTWTEELALVRGKLAHGDLSPLRGHTSRWTPSEHLLFASEVFPCLVMKMLADANIYSLTARDQERIDLLEVRLLLPPGKGDSFRRLWQGARYWQRCADTEGIDLALYVKREFNRILSGEYEAERHSPPQLYPLRFGPRAQVSVLIPCEAVADTESGDPTGQEKES